MRFPPPLLRLALVALALVSSCQKPRRPHSTSPPPVVQTALTSPVPPVPSATATSEDTTAELEPSPLDCATRIAEELAKPSLPGAATLEAQRLSVLMESKAEPVWFVATPQYGAEEVPAPIARYRKQLSETKFPVDVLARLIPIFAPAPKVGRQVLLRDGYLFADNPNLARALVTGVTVEHLFAHDRIWLRRGEVLMHAERRKGLYYYTDGPNAGDRVTLLLFDQLGHDDVPMRVLARDFRSLAARLHFDRVVEVKHATDSAMVVDLSYADLKVQTLLQSSGAHLDLACEITQDHAKLAGVRQERATRYDLVQRLRATMLEEVAEKLPFDEPRREWGLQLDGKLRQNWRHAYLLQRASFAFNGDRYFVFDAKGRPIVPQVCVDFLTDTLERTSGTWWRQKGAPPGRDTGRLDFDAVKSPMRDELRRVPTFVGYARREVDQFDVLDVPDAERIPLGDHTRFLEYITSHRQDFQPGDIVVIRGPTPWDRRQQHYHSFFVYENDPVTGVPIAVLGNAGRPTVRHWRVEAQRTPKRSIQHRLRLRTEWLLAVVDPSQPAAPVPPPLSPKGNPG